METIITFASVWTFKVDFIWKPSQSQQVISKFFIPTYSKSEENFVDITCENETEKKETSERRKKTFSVVATNWLKSDSITLSEWERKFAFHGTKQMWTGFPHATLWISLSIAHAMPKVSVEVTRQLYCIWCLTASGL